MQNDLQPEQSFLKPSDKPWTQEAITGERFVNYLIDAAVFLFFFFGINFLIGFLAAANGHTVVAHARSTFEKVTDSLFIYLLYVVFYFFCEGASHGRSIGKLVTRTKAVKSDGSSISWEDAFMRSLCRLIPFDPLSAFAGHPWHDELSKTKVIKLD